MKNRVRRWGTAAVAGVCILLLGAGCGQRKVSDEAQYKKIIQELSDKAGRLSAENEKLRAELAATKLKVEMLRKKGQVWEGISDELRAALARLKQPGVELTDTGVSIAGSVLFDPGKYTIKPQGRKILKQVAAIMKNRKEVLRIDGHTDSDPIRVSRKWGIRSNRHLSAMRALAVIETLKKYGMDPRRMILAAYGEYWPVADNSTAAGKRKNRRVEIVVLPPRAMPLPPLKGTTSVPAKEKARKSPLK